MGITRRRFLQDLGASLSALAWQIQPKVWLPLLLSPPANCQYGASIYGGGFYSGAAPPVNPTVTISEMSHDIHLSWDGNAGNVSYEIWRSLHPYFAAGDPDSQLLDTVTGTSYIDVNSQAGNAGSNYFYLVRGVNDCGLPSDPDAQQGEFDFDITAGEP